MRGHFGGMKVGQSILRKPAVVDNMMEELDAPSSMDGEVEINALLGGLYDDDYSDDKHKKHHHHKKKKPKMSMEQHIEYLYLYWHAWWQTACQITIVGLLAAILSGGIIVGGVVGTSQQMAKAVMLVDRVHEMHDYTKTMTDVTTESQAEMRKMMQEYDVNGMISTVKKMVDTGGAIVNNLKPETLQQASEMGSKLIETLQHIDFEQGKQLMTHLNDWATNVDPHKFSAGIEKATDFLKRGADALKTAEDHHVIQSVGQFATGAVDLEARLQRLDEITIKLPKQQQRA